MRFEFESHALKSLRSFDFGCRPIRMWLWSVKISVISAGHQRPPSATSAS